ncbi:MAG TPA: NADH-quinone oxidoreductase subunit N [bacterium]|nr:NADH-quinone oxidoreductase subunit N [bacterium]
MTWDDLLRIAPELVLTVAACVVLLQDAWVTGPVLESEARGPAGTWIALAAVCVALVVNARPVEGPGGAFGGMYVRDHLTRIIDFAALAAAGLGVLLSPGYVQRARLPAGEYYALLLLSTVGAMLMGASRNLVVLFLGLEILSFPLYVMAALARRSELSQEAGLKYLLLGAFATAFFVYGIALIYGATGTVDLARIAEAPVSPLLGAGVALLTIGLGFEAALVPFHAWAPDVYEGAPLPVTAFMSVIAKVGAFAGLVRVFPLALPHLEPAWGQVLAAIAVATMITGNLAALVQSNVKRLLAYSSVAHAGYLLIGIASGGADGTWAVLFYLLVYVAMNLGAFGVLLLLERRGEEADRLEDLAGLAGRAPWAAAALALCMVSLAGLPPTAGFIAKLYLFRAALLDHRTGLALVGVLTSVVSVYYYLRVAYVALSGGAADAVAVRRSALAGAALVIAVAGVLWLGLFPAAVTAAVQQAVAALR